MSEKCKKYIKPKPLNRETVWLDNNNCFYAKYKLRTPISTKWIGGACAWGPIMEEDWACLALGDLVSSSAETVCVRGASTKWN